jgi:hypothetical protein
MISFWQVLGRCCVDPEFYKELLKRVDTNYPPRTTNSTKAWVAIDSPVPKNMYNFLAEEKRYRISLFEVWEIVRFFSPDPKGPGTHSVVRDAIQAMHDSTKDLKFDPFVYEILGVCCVDRRFTHALAENAKKGDIGPFLKVWGYEPASDAAAASVKELMRFAVQPAFVIMFGAITQSDWDEPCDESRSFDPAFNDRNPWGSPGAWFGGEALQRAKQSINS